MLPDRLSDVRVGVIGNGMVGAAVIRGFAEHAKDIIVHDADPRRSSGTLAEAADTDLLVLCLPTPASAAGGCDTSVIEACVEQLRPLLPGRTVVAVKSTVPVGFCNFLTTRLPGNSIVHWPEFLTARCNLIDFQTPARNIVGATDNHVAGAAWLSRLLRARFPGVPVLEMGSAESELTKLCVNSFFAVKVTWFNAVKQLADAAGCSFEAVRHGMLTDGRIAHAHTSVPGPDELPGYGGACLPKDLENLRRCAEQLGATAAADIMAAVAAANAAIRPGG